MILGEPLRVKDGNNSIIFHLQKVIDKWFHVAWHMKHHVFTKISKLPSKTIRSNCFG